MISKIKVNFFKGILSTIVGIGIVGYALKIMYDAKDITTNGVILTLIGLIAFGLPDPNWQKVLDLLKFWKKDNDTKPE